MNKLKEKHAITLIALVITIIVMLILVAVTITMTVNGGLFRYAGRAAKETETEKQREQDLVTLSENMTTEDLIVKYTGLWHETNDEKITNGQYTLSIGDYIKYNCYNGTNYQESGFTVNSNSNSLKWQVLGIENNSILLVSENSLGSLQLNGEDGYLNGADLLNNICAIYGHGANAISARSLNIDDVDKLTGYDPEHDSINNTGADAGKPFAYGTVRQYKNGPVTYEKTANNITYTYGDNQVDTFGNSNSKLINIGDTENSTILVVENTFYTYHKSIVANNATKTDMLFNRQSCWLANSYVATHLGTVYWGLRGIDSYGVGTGRPFVGDWIWCISL